MEQTTQKEMTPEQVNNDNPEDRNNTFYELSKAVEHYLAYVANQDIKMNPGLLCKNDYRMEVIDTWYMKNLSSPDVAPGSFEFQPERPYTALRLINIKD